MENCLKLNSKDALRGNIAHFTVNFAIFIALATPQFPEFVATFDFFAIACFTNQSTLSWF